MGLFTSLVDFEIVGRRYQIVYNDKLKEPVKSVFEETVKLFCKNGDLIARFPEIQFIVQNKSHPFVGGQFAWVFDASSASYTKPLVINLSGTKLNNEFADYLEKSGEEKAISFLIGIFLHEVTHIMHELRSKAISRNIKSLGRLRQRQTIDWLSDEKLDPLKLRIYNIRSLYRSFINLIHTEGLAEFVRHIGLDDYTPEYEEKLYLENKKLVEEVVILNEVIIEKMRVLLKRERVAGKEIDEHLDFRSFKKKMKLISYGLGEYIYYILRYHSKRLNLFKIKPFKLIKTYEKIELKNGKIPLISVNSGAGIFDYNRLLVDWGLAYKEMKKKVN